MISIMVDKLPLASILMKQLLLLKERVNGRKVCDGYMSGANERKRKHQSQWIRLGRFGS